jgi:hypothetical protein
VLALSKSSKKRQASNSTDEPAASEGNRTVLIIAGIIIVVLLGAAIWLYVLPNINGPVTPNSIVGTWADKNNYHAYAYYSNGQVKEMGWLTLVSTGAHVPYTLNGTWTSLGNNYYLINPDTTQNTTFETLINGTQMNVLNVSNGGITYKLSNVPNVYLVNFSYAR